VARIAYLLSQYPAVNHVFMLREVRLLRQMGLDARVVSIRNPDRDSSAMTAAEQEEARSAYYVKGTGLGRLAQSQIRTAWARPAGYFRGLMDALRFGPRGLFYFAEAVAVGDWMRRNGLGHVHTHYAGTVGWIVARIFPVTLSITFHGPAEFENITADHIREKVAASLFSCAISQYGLDQLKAASAPADWPRLEVTMLGVDPAEFPPTPFRREPSPFQIVCVGRLAPVKGQHVLIAAMDQLVKAGRQIRLHLAGDGPDRAELEREAASRGLREHIVFEGNLNQDKLRALYRESDALVLSSFAEGLPVVLMEAMAMQIPCVASAVNGVPEIISDGIDGLLAPAGDVAAFARAIARLMDDAEGRRAMGEKARLTVLAKFVLQRNTEHLAGVFRRRLRLPETVSPSSCAR
jgi:colanic acid/amylovoran biosynthesis glycosyltransferase